MPNDGRIATKSDLPDPDEGTSGKRALVTESEAQNAVDQASDIAWDVINNLIHTYDPFLRSANTAAALSRGAIDGYGIELSFGAELQAFGGVEFTPIGICLLWITNSDASVSDEGVEVDPMDNPHYFLFGSSAVASGAAITAGVNVENAHFLAHRFGGGENTAQSFGGPSVSFGTEASAKVLGGAGAGGSYWSSANYNEPEPNGVATFAWPNDGWEGVSFAVSVGAGLGVTLLNFTVGQGDHNMSLTEHMNSVANWAEGTAESAYNIATNVDRDRVGEEMKDTEPVPEQGDMNYQKDTPMSGLMLFLTNFKHGPTD